MQRPPPPAPTQPATSRLAGDRRRSAPTEAIALTRYKRIGDMLVVEPPRKTVEEVSVRELSRSTSEVLERVRAGGRVVVTRYGAPAAVLIEVDEAIGLCGTVVLSRREAERRLFGDELDADLRRRDLARAPRILGGD